MVERSERKVKMSETPQAVKEVVYELRVALKDTSFILIRQPDRFVLGSRREMCVWTSHDTAEAFIEENNLGPEWEIHERPVVEIKEQARKLGFTALIFDTHSMTATYDRRYMRQSV